MRRGAIEPPAPPPCVSAAPVPRPRPARTGLAPWPPALRSSQSLCLTTNSLCAAVEMLEMVVADDLRPQQGASARRPSKRLVPAPHKAAPKVAAQPPAAAPSPAPPKLNGSNGKLSTALNGSSSGSGGLNGSATLSAAGATLQVPSGNGPPPAVQQLVARQSLIKAASAEISVAQRQVQEQQLEIKGLRTQLA